MNRARRWYTIVTLLYDLCSDLTIFYFNTDCLFWILQPLIENNLVVICCKQKSSTLLITSHQNMLDCWNIHKMCLLLNETPRKKKHQMMKEKIVKTPPLENVHKSHGTHKLAFS